MFSHIIKLIWKKKKSNFLMMLEIFFSFLILFAVWSLSVYSYRNYVQPTGLTSEQVWTVYLQFNANNDTVQRECRTLVNQYLKGTPEIESWSFSSPNLPFSFSSCNNEYAHEGRSALSDVMNVEPDYPKVLGMRPAAGRWFEAADTIGGQKPVVITRHLAESLFGNEDPIGKTLGVGENTHKVLGLVDHFRHKSSFQEEDNCVFEPSYPDNSALLIKVKPGADAEFEARLARGFQQLGKDWTVEIDQLDKMRSTQNRLYWIPILILFVVCAFLVFNVALGLFGVLFQNISRRRGEIGLRRAIGATQKQILTYFVAETLVIAGFGIVLGVFFAVQIPLLHVFDIDSIVYAWGILLAIASVIVITVLCAFYPSRQAAAIYPATALHEE